MKERLCRGIGPSALLQDDKTLAGAALAQHQDRQGGDGVGDERDGWPGGKNRRKGRGQKGGGALEDINLLFSSFFSLLDASKIWNFLVLAPIALQKIWLIHH